MKTTFFSLLIAFTAIHLNAQWYDADKAKPKAKLLYNKGIEKAQDQIYSDAIQYLRLALNEDEKYVDAYLSMGGIFGEMKDYWNSISSYKKAIEMDSVYTKPYLLPFSINLAGAGEYKEALEVAQKFKTIKGLNEKSLRSADYRIKCYQFALDYAKNNKTPYSFQPRNMGDSVNTKDSEYFPSVTIDGKKLVFTRRLNNFNEDFFETNLNNGKWSKGQSLTGDVNTENNEGAQNISQDGSILFFTGCNFPFGAGSCDLYYSLWVNNAWTKPLPAGRNINTEFWESQPSLSPDKRNLYFTARDPMGLGGSDLYMSTMNDKGSWGVPVNLGKTINTAGNESCPFIHADNETLYFTSDTHAGYGGEDLFYSRKDENGKWTTPVNLGSPINTVENEGSLVIAADGETAYYASDRSDTRGGLDIYTFKLPQQARPRKTFYITGVVYDSISKKPISSVIDLVDLANGKQLQKIQSDNNGLFFATLPVGKNYVFTVNRKGYLFYSDNFNLVSPLNDTTYQKNIPLQPLTKNALIVLNNIFYETNKFAIKPESKIELDKVVQLMNENPTLRIEIDGHTDNVGSAKTNTTLSNNRSKEVVKYLVSKGINIKRLEAKGFGANKPLADNNTEAGKAKNRRTELKVLSI